MSREETNEHWEGKWTTGEFGWHLEKVNPYLKESFHHMHRNNNNNNNNSDNNQQRGGNVERTPGKWMLVPLCGKTVDMMWFYEKGMSVVGIELSETPILDFFTENYLEYSVQEHRDVHGCTVYKHDERLQIYKCDLFGTIPNELKGKFDHFWDRGALVAIHSEEQATYWSIIDSLLANSAQGLLETVENEHAVIHPYSVPFDRLTRILGTGYKAEEVSRRNQDELADEDTSRLAGCTRDIVMYHVKKHEI